MLLFGVPILEIIAVGTVLLGLVGAYYRLQNKSDNSEQAIESSNTALMEKLDAVEKDMSKRFDELEKNSKFHQERDKEWRIEQERRISVLEAESRTHAATSAAVVSSLADLKAQQGYVITRMDSYFMRDK